jgi:ankyrin repeat protein
MKPGTDLNLAERLLQSFLPKLPEDGGSSPLHRLAHTHNSETLACELALADLLLDRGVELDHPGAADFTPLEVALMHGRNRLAAHLIDRGADPNRIAAQEKRRPLHILADWPNLAGMRLLVERGADINAQKDEGWTALAISVRRHKKPIVKTLLDLGADPNLGTSTAETPLTLALNGRQQEVIGWLLESRADILARNRFMRDVGQSALMICILNGWTELAFGCLLRGAPVDEPDDRDYTCLHWAVIKDQPDVVEALLARGARIDHRTVDGFTPHDFALRSDNQPMAELLNQISDSKK